MVAVNKVTSNDDKNILLNFTNNTNVVANVLETILFELRDNFLWVVHRVADILVIQIALTTAIVTVASKANSLKASSDANG